MPYCLRRTQTKKTVRNKETQHECRVLLVKTHWRLIFIAVVTVHTKKRVYYMYTFQQSIQAIRSIDLLLEKAPVYRLSRSKAPKTQKICPYRHTRQTGELFLLFNKGVNFSLRNNFANSGSFAKVSVPIHIYNSLVCCKS